MCGERNLRQLGILRKIGSSPHVRGTPLKRDGPGFHGRFIPACAGNATSISIVSWPRAVHPRMCGERLPANPRRQRCGGSSPHVRGTQQPSEAEDTGQRFIPACAGNAGYKKVERKPPTVHPRMCGERATIPDEVMGDCGSSPHVRGTLKTSRCPPGRCRFIPACAGNAHSLISFQLIGPVHPRMCGERKVPPVDVLPANGSSPHVRGTLIKHDGDIVSYRFIPACAGNAR